MSNNFANSQKPQYRSPSKLPADWTYIGQGGKLNYPIIGHPAMHGRRWMIDYGYDSGKGFQKFQQGLKK